MCTGIHTYFYCVSLYCTPQILRFFFCFTNWGFAATLYWADLLVPFFQQHFLTLCLYCTTFWWLSQYFLKFLLLYCYGDLYSVSLDVTTVIVLGSYNWHPYKMVNSIDKYVCVLTAPPTCCFPISLPLLGPSYSLKYIILKLGQLLTLSWTLSV